MKCILDWETFAKTGAARLLIYERSGMGTVVGEMKWVAKEEGAAIPGPTLTLTELEFRQLYESMGQAMQQILTHQIEQDRQRRLQQFCGFRKDSLGNCETCGEFWPVMSEKGVAICHKCFAAINRVQG